MASSTPSTRPIIISGPSGTGKSTILNRLLAAYPTHFGFSISHTTRQPRGAERNGHEYHFIDRAAFDALIADGVFLEHAQFGGNKYGTSIAAVKDVQDAGRICILDIEMEGVKQMVANPEMGKVGGCRVLFLAPPSMAVLEERLRGRGTDGEEAVRKRLAKAREETAFARSGEVSGAKVVVNAELDAAYEEVRAWVFEGETGGA